MINIIFLVCFVSITIVAIYSYTKLRKNFNKITKDHSDFLAFVDIEIEKINKASVKIKEENISIRNDWDVLLKQYKIAYDVIIYLGQKYNISMEEMQELIKKIENDALNNEDKIINNETITLDLDIILDKINSKGYNSLTEKEKEFLTQHKKQI